MFLAFASLPLWHTPEPHSVTRKNKNYTMTQVFSKETKQLAIFNRQNTWLMPFSNVGDTVLMKCGYHIPKVRLPTSLKGNVHKKRKNVDYNALRI